MCGRKLLSFDLSTVLVLSREKLLRSSDRRPLFTCLLLVQKGRVKKTRCSDLDPAVTSVLPL